MKKWMITYGFILGFLGLILCGHAMPVKADNIHSRSRITAKKTFPVAIENKNSGRADCCTINHRTRFQFSVTQSFALTENNTSSLPYSSYRDIAIARGVEKVLKDHLLHLFPSHYFW